MYVYLVISYFNVIAAVIGPLPYTMEGCIESLKVLRPAPELESKFQCVSADAKPELDIFTPEQQKLIDDWVTKQEGR